MTKPFVLLAIDQAARSGSACALVDNGACDIVGVLDTRAATERQGAVAMARSLADEHRCDLHVLFEDHSNFYFGRGNASYKSFLGMGAARGRWLEQVELAGVKKAHEHEVSPKTWRKAVLGLPGNVSKEHAKAAALVHARAVLGKVDVSEDVAEAVCMLLWGARNIAPKKRGGGLCGS